MLQVTAAGWVNDSVCEAMVIVLAMLMSQLPAAYGSTLWATSEGVTTVPSVMEAAHVWSVPGPEEEADLVIV